MNTRKKPQADGFALLAALLMLLLISAISVGMIYMVNSEVQVLSSDKQNTQAYYGAEAAMERMMVDLSYLYILNQSPSASAIRGLSVYQPTTLPGITFPEYAFNVEAINDVPRSRTQTIQSGTNAGLISQVIPINLTATARQAGGAESRMTRQIQVALIPVFQFGMFSDGDLSFFPGPIFRFGGRVHTNGNLFMAEGGGLDYNGNPDTGQKLIFTEKVSAAGEVIRAVLSNGDSTVTTRTGLVLVPQVAGGCNTGDAVTDQCRHLNWDEGSKVNGPTSADNTQWSGLSTSTYNGYIVNWRTGGTMLQLPFVSPGLRPIEIIRRPPATGDANNLMSQSRLYNLAQIRVLLTDRPEDLPGGVADVAQGYNVPLRNNIAASSPCADCLPFNADGINVTGAGITYFGYGQTTPGLATSDTNWVSPRSGLTDWPLIDGYLRVEIRRTNGTYLPVTQEWLTLGFARKPTSDAVTVEVHPNAILYLQQLADKNMSGAIEEPPPPTPPATTYPANSEFDDFVGIGSRFNFHPINLYDTREGEIRDSTASGTTTLGLGGILNGVELNVANLRRWLNGEIGAAGPLVESISQNGYIFYFSDRRGMLSPSTGSHWTGPKLGEYGMEDMINPTSSTGAADRSLDNPPQGYLVAEDVNSNNQLDSYGMINLGDGFNTGAQGAYPPETEGLPALGSLDDPTTTRIARGIAYANQVSGARHALKLINGSLGNVPVPGFTLASENPVYIKGDYNSNAAGFNTGDGHSAASIVADAVTLLSNHWHDLQGFRSPVRPTQDGNALFKRKATTTWYRLAIAAGKNRSFPKPTWGAAADYGTDGGAHNFLRYVEDWGGQTLNYMGSLVSFYNAEQAVGVYKCCTTVYSPPIRQYLFDQLFLDPTNLPPGTPLFRDVVNLGYRQDIRPPQ
jgi:hypothetical protein